MVIINYPEPKFRIKKEAGKVFIFDPQRKKWLIVTPEEWVRQNFIQYLVQVKKYPAALIAIEKELQLGDLKKRFDVLVYDDEHRPWMMIECKAMEVKLDESVLHQVIRYNMGIPVPYLVITNGSYCFVGKRDEVSFSELAEFPIHSSLAE